MFLMLAVSSASDGISVTLPWQWLWAILGAAAAGLLATLVKWIWPSIVAHFRAVRRLRRAEIALDEKSPGLWLAPSIPLSPPRDYKRLMLASKPIIVVANLKGGVGKTTTVANLVGHYALKKGKRVLAIDMDFQGSLSSVLLSRTDYDQSLQEQIDGTPSKAAQLITKKDALWLKDISDSVDGVPKARCVPSYYTLSIMENRVMVEWLIAKRKEDVRYNLAHTLLDRDIQDRFDVILIDAPPRLTTGCVQALCAATHVLIPAVLDGLSAEASGGFVSQLATNQSLWPHLKLLGVFGNMTDVLTVDTGEAIREAALSDYEAEARQSAIDTVRVALEDAAPILRSRQGEPAFPTECFIPNRRELGRGAGDRIVYRHEGGSDAVKQISRAFDRLGDEIDRRISAASYR